MNPERRHDARRESDALLRQILDQCERWGIVMLRHRGKLMAGVSALSLACGYGVGYIGRAHDLDGMRAAAARTDSAYAARLGGHDSSIARNRKDIDRLVSSAEINRVLLCVIADKVGASTGGKCQQREAP